MFFLDAILLGCLNGEATMYKENQMNVPKLNDAHK